MTQFDAIETQGLFAKSEPIKVAFDTTELMKEGFKSGVYEKPTFVDKSSDRLLPQIKLDLDSIGAESRLPLFSTANLDDRDRRTSFKAEQAVQDKMTPEQRKQLHEDKRKYDEAVAAHKRADMIGALPFGYNKMPEKPESLKQYEKAVQAEITRQDPKFFANTYLIDGEYFKPSNQPRHEISPEEWKRLIQDGMKHKR